MKVTRRDPNRETEYVTLLPATPVERELLATLPARMVLVELAIVETANGRITSTRGGQCLPDAHGENVFITLRMRRGTH